MGKAKLSTDLEYPQNLLYDVFGEEIRLPDDYLATTEYVLSTALTDRQKTMVEMRYKVFCTYSQIAKRYNLTENRIAQIINRALRILRIPKYRECLQYGIKERIRHLKEKLNETRQRNLMIQAETNPDIKLEREIEELDFSIRTFNCLKRAGIETVKDILSLSPKEFFHIRNLGRKSFHEIIDTLGSQGYDVSKFKKEFSKEYIR